jgi:hypothetical protein
MYQVLAAAIGITRADKGTVQILDDATNHLKIVANHGFGEAFLFVLR